VRVLYFEDFSGFGGSFLRFLGGPGCGFLRKRGCLEKGGKSGGVGEVCAVGGGRSVKVWGTGFLIESGSWCDQMCQKNVSVV
jgi:hypothetical protein